MEKEIEVPDKTKLWSYIVNKGKKVEAGYIQNKFNKDDITTIIATMDFFGASDIWQKQSAWDLGGAAKFRLFDWLGMCVMSRNNDDRKGNKMALQVLVWSWLKTDGDPTAFIQDLRESDYQIDESWDKVEIND